MVLLQSSDKVVTKSKCQSEPFGHSRVAGSAAQSGLAQKQAWRNDLQPCTRCPARLCWRPSWEIVTVLCGQRSQTAPAGPGCAVGLQPAVLALSGLTSGLTPGSCGRPNLRQPSTSQAL